jgi:hypothetical protein
MIPRARERAASDQSPADRLSSNTPSFSKMKIIEGVSLNRWGTLDRT